VRNTAVADKSAYSQVVHSDLTHQAATIISSAVRLFKGPTCSEIYREVTIEILYQYLEASHRVLTELLQICTSHYFPPNLAPSFSHLLFLLSSYKNNPD
jgi:hypothetical protein